MAFCAAILLLLGTGCAREGNGDAGAELAHQAPARAATPASAATVELTVELLDAYERGLAKELEVLQRPGRGTHYGVTLSSHSPEAQDVAEAAGLPLDTYKAVARQVDRVFTILNFQGKIGPPRSVRVDQVGEEMRRRLASDPFDELSPGSAAALRSRMDRLTPIWSRIISFTANNG